MYDEDHDALAAEYVLGTLSAEERSQTEALLQIDSGFAEVVRQWERRLGELNVMVESVEPPAAVWEKIKPQIGMLAPGDEVRLAPIEPTPPGPPSVATPPLAPALKTDMERKAAATPEPKVEAEATAEGEQSAILAALASSLLSPQEEAESRAETRAEVKPPKEWTLQPPSPLAPPKIEGSAEVFYLAHHLRLWRQTAIGAGALAALLAIFIAVSLIAPGVIPGGGMQIPVPFAQSSAPAAPGSRFVAVLQQEPTAPAFLLTIDPAARTLTVRRVAGAAAAGHAYQLWWVSARSLKPRSLGLVGGEEFTQQPLPGELDREAMRGATFEISFEPAGGAKSGAPSGPILFTGRIVEAVPPPSLPSAAK